MKPGDPVEVAQAWAANGPGLAPSYAWSKGYAYVRTEDNGNIIVEHTAGLFAGERRRYAFGDVRKDYGSR